jgi:hypothetical protein
MRHALDETSLLPDPWAEGELQEPDPRCECGLPWTDEGCGATWLYDLRVALGMARVNFSYWVRPYSMLLDRRCWRWRRPRCHWTGSRG